MSSLLTAMEIYGEDGHIIVPINSEMGYEDGIDLKNETFEDKRKRFFMYWNTIIELIDECKFLDLVPRNIYFWVPSEFVV